MFTWLPLADGSVMLTPGGLRADSFHFEQMVYLGPVLVLVGTALLILLADISLRAIRVRGGLPASGSLAIGTLGGLAAAAYAAWFIWKGWGQDAGVELFQAIGAPGSSDVNNATLRGYQNIGNWQSGALVVDNLSLLVCLITCGILILTLVTLFPYLKQRKLFKSELIPLLLLSATGAVLLGMSRDVLVTFISIEVLSLPLYVLCGLDERRDASRESSLKYFLLGAFASGFFIYGTALLYGAVGHLNYAAIEEYFYALTQVGLSGPNSLAAMGVALVGVGIAFKLALVPFQAWLPDVYQGAPTPITAFMASAVKLGIFIAALRFIIEALNHAPESYWRTPLAIFAVASMVIGNLFALHQMSLKRLLAYSAITHTGYLTLALCAGSIFAIPGLLVYLVAYYLASFGAFTLIAYMAPPGQDDIYLDELSDFGQRAPALSGAMVILVLSMIGMPLTAGFVGKLLVFTSAWNAGLTWLVVVAVLNSVVSAFFYLRILRSMYMQPAVPGASQLVLPKMSRGYIIPTAITVALTLVLGILPDMLILLATGHT